MAQGVWRGWGKFFHCQFFHADTQEAVNVNGLYFFSLVIQYLLISFLLSRPLLSSVNLFFFSFNQKTKTKKPVLNNSSIFQHSHTSYNNIHCASPPFSSPLSLFSPIFLSATTSCEGLVVSLRRLIDVRRLETKSNASESMRSGFIYKQRSKMATYNAERVIAEHEFVVIWLSL